jgi:heat-inducible transcriptional repressor
VNSQGLSPATIRNIMSDLEELGYLYQPHTSSGRIPTDRGYRVYVSTLMESYGVGPDEQQLIKRQMLAPDAGLDELLGRASRLLSNLTGMVGFVVRPDFRYAVLRHVDFVRLGPRRVLVVLVSQTAQVTNRVIELPDDLTGEELAQCARYLEDQFRGYTLLEARELLVVRMKELKAAVDDLTRNALTIAEAAFPEEMPADVHLEGTSRMLSAPEFTRNIDRAQQLFATLEERQRLVSILNACLEGDELQIVIGSETSVPDLKGISLIGARYTDGSHGLGSIGIMGPTRMEYARHVSVVDYIAGSLSAAITDVGGEQHH